MTVRRSRAAFQHWKIPHSEMNFAEKKATRISMLRHHSTARRPRVDGNHVTVLTPGLGEVAPPQAHTKTCLDKLKDLHVSVRRQAARCFTESSWFVRPTDKKDAIWLGKSPSKVQLFTGMLAVSLFSVQSKQTRHNRRPSKSLAVFASLDCCPAHGKDNFL